MDGFAPIGFLILFALGASLFVAIMSFIAAVAFIACAMIPAVRQQRPPVRVLLFAALVAVAVAIAAGYLAWRILASLHWP